VFEIHSRYLHSPLRGIFEQKIDGDAAALLTEDNAVLPQRT